MGKSVLIVDDSAQMRSRIREAMLSAGCDVINEASTGESAIDKSIELEPDIITLDNILPDMVGTDILKVIVDQRLQSKVIIISAIAQQYVIDEGLKLGASEYLVKPFTKEQLTDIVNQL